MGAGMAAAASFRAKTSIGADGLSFAELKATPDEIVEDLAAIVLECVEKVDRPRHQLLTTLHLLPKKKAAFRTIGTLITFVRTIMSMLGPMMRKGHCWG